MMKTHTKIQIKAVANKWMSDNLNGERVLLSLGVLKKEIETNTWAVELLAKSISKQAVGTLRVDAHGHVVQVTDVKQIVKGLVDVGQSRDQDSSRVTQRHAWERGLFYGDGIEAARRLENQSIDLLLTDPPYVISNAYTCQKQIPRRLRKDGSDFIMPKGDFGEWDRSFDPRAWAEVVLPKVTGWAVIFCSHTQIAEYSVLLREHGFNAVGTIVWHKTNPVPFNHRFKPINAWEAGVIGKRPGTKFHGHAVHNVFTCKSPSPQQRIHPTQKPCGLIRELMELFSRKGDLVLDPFAGSGTTAYVALELGRKVLAYENNAEHYDAARRRLSSVQLTI